MRSATKFLAAKTLLRAWVLWTLISHHSTATSSLKNSAFCISSRLDLPYHLHQLLESSWLSLLSGVKATPWPSSGKNTNFIERLRLPSKCIAFAAFQCPCPLKGSLCSSIATYQLPWAPAAPSSASDKQKPLLDFGHSLWIARAGIPPGPPYLPIQIKPKCTLSVSPGIPVLLSSQSLPP